MDEITRVSRKKRSASERSLFSTTWLTEQRDDQRFNRKPKVTSDYISKVRGFSYGSVAMVTVV